MTGKQKRAEANARGTVEGLHHAALWALAGTIFLLPLLIWPGLTDYNYTKTIASLVLISALLVLWGFTAWSRKAWTLRVPWAMVASVGIVVAGALSMIQAANARVSAQSILLVAYFILLSWMIANVVRNERDARWLLGALFASALLVGLYGLLQYVGVMRGKTGGEGVTAILSTLGNRNHLGALMLYLFYPATGLLIAARNAWAKGSLIALLVFSFVILLLVRQAASQIGFIVATLFVVVGAWRLRLRKTLRRERLWLALLMASVFLAAAAFVTWNVLSPPSAEDDLVVTQESSGSLLERLWNANSGPHRELMWWAGAHMLADRPIVGVGLGNYKIDFLAAKTDVLTGDRGAAYDFHLSRVSQAHSELVQTVAELGIVGILFVGATLAVLAFSLWSRMRRASGSRRLQLLLLATGLVAALVHSLVSFPAHVVSSSLAFVTLCGLALSPAYGDATVHVRTLPRWQGRALHAVFLILAVVVSGFAIADARANWLMERGIDAVQAGRYAFAEATLQHSLRLDFAPRQTYYYLAVAQIQQGHLEDALANLEKCMTRFVDELVCLTYAELQASLGAYEEAQRALDVVLTGHPLASVDERARYIGAVIAIKQRDFDRALQMLETLAVDYPTFERGRIALGQLYAAQGLTQSARVNFEAALATIDEKLRIAEAALASTGSAMSTTYERTRLEIDQLREQRTLVLSELSALP